MAEYNTKRRLRIAWFGDVEVEKMGFYWSKEAIRIHNVGARKYSCSISLRLTKTRIRVQDISSDIKMLMKHCVRSVQIRSFLWSVFSYIWTEYGDLLRKSSYSLQTQENTDQKKLRIWTLFMQWRNHTASSQAPKNKLILQWIQKNRIQSFKIKDKNFQKNMNRSTMTSMVIDSVYKTKKKWWWW